MGNKPKKAPAVIQLSGPAVIAEVVLMLVRQSRELQAMAERLENITCGCGKESK